MSHRPRRFETPRAWRAPLALALVLALAAPPALRALDTGLLQHALNLNLMLPRPDRAVGPEEAREAVRRHIRWVLEQSPAVEGPMADYWADYRRVLEKYPEPSKALPVYVETDGGRVVARYLVGLRMGGPVGGFIAVDPADGSIMTKLLWTPKLKPLWMLPESEWNGAASVNDIPYLEEMVPPFTQFTTGIPIDPRQAMADGFWFVDHVFDLPLKTQEERQEHVEAFNNDHGTDLKVTLRAHRGRRTATSKCMSVAASYMGDWWQVQTRGPLPTYQNGVGGQKEYGFNPRLLETIFYARRRAGGILGKWMGDFKTAPFGSDRVTGEPIPYSPRGYARILAETGAATYPDNLVPTLLQYETRENHFAMDQKPLLFQVCHDGIFASATLRADLADAQKPDYPFLLEAKHGEAMTPERLAQALHTWGPMLAQHMGRGKTGDAVHNYRASGVHACQLVGYGTHEGRMHFVYRETFGDCSHRYLEDSFLGPTYRIMPIEYFWQAIAFPHVLYLGFEVTGEADGGMAATVSVTTNRRVDPVDPDEIFVLVDGARAEEARVVRRDKGVYRVWLPQGTADGASRIEVRARKKYFADGEGRSLFGVTAQRAGSGWATADASPAAAATAEALD